jgi:hypothetical protein
LTGFNLSTPLRTSLLASAPIATKLRTYLGGPGVHTRRPLPADANYPCIAISPDVSYGNEDGLTNFRDVVTRDIFAYGEQPDDYRVVEELGYLLRDHFHRKRFSIISDDFSVASIVATGPMIAPTDDEKIVARMVSLSIRLQPKP